MMDRATFDALCSSLPATFMVEQWGHSHVWKVGNQTTNKVFALSTFRGEGSVGDPAAHALVFKVAPTSFELLTMESGIDQAPYFAKGHWVRVLEDSPLSEEDITAYVQRAHQIMAGGLTRKLQAELGLVDWVVAGRS